MMAGANIFRQMESGGAIFKDERFLLPEYLPEQLPGREREIKEMASYLNEATKGRAPPSILLLGRPGTGKTTTSKLLLKQLCEVSTKPMQIYINCWENSTRFGILSQLITEFGDMLPRRGIALDEIVQRIGELGKREKHIPIIILDEVDRLVASTTGEEQVLYDLSRPKEALGIEASVIAITNDEELAMKLDPRIRSSLTNNSIKFESYNPLQLKHILKERAVNAFFPGVCDEEIIGVCAAVGAKAGGDARVSIQVLWSAGKKAEREGARKISLEHVKEVKGKAVLDSTTPAKRKGEELDDIDTKLVEMISKAKNGIDSGDIYLKMKADEGEQRTIRNRLERMEKAGLIECEKTGDKFGRTRNWKISNSASK